MMLNIKAIVRLPDDDTDFFDIVAGSMVGRYINAISI